MKSTININYVEGRDGGTYECRASNPYGVATFNIHLNILGEQFFPLFNTESNVKIIVKVIV